MRENDLPEILAHLQSNERSTGTVSPITIGHIDPFERDETKQPPVAGVYRNAVIGRWGPEQKIGILADEYLLPEWEPHRANYPHRSVDYIPGRKQIKAVALLTRPPMLDMGMVGLQGGELVEQFQLPGVQDMIPAAYQQPQYVQPAPQQQQQQPQPVAMTGFLAPQAAQGYGFPVGVPSSLIQTQPAPLQPQPQPYANPAAPLGFNFGAMGAASAPPMGGMMGGGMPGGMGGGGMGMMGGNPMEGIAEAVRAYMCQKFGLDPNWPAAAPAAPQAPAAEPKGDVMPMQAPMTFQLPDGRLIVLPAGTRPQAAPQPAPAPFLPPIQNPALAYQQPQPIAYAGSPGATPLVDSYAQAQIGNLQQQLAGVMQQNTINECVGYLYQLQGEGFQFDANPASPVEFQYQLNELVKRPAAERPAYVSRLRKYYEGSKIPGSQIANPWGSIVAGPQQFAGPQPLPMPIAADPSSPFAAPPAHDAAMSFMMANPGMSYGQALATVSAPAGGAK